MKRLIPIELLNILENWFRCYFSCVKWYDLFSVLFSISFGVRPGSVLSPFIFAIYTDDVAKLCHMTPGVFIILYADDIMLLAPTVCELNRLLKKCQCELDQIYHRLRGSTSPVLTATHHSYGTFWLFFRLTHEGQTPQPIFTQNGSNDVDSCKDDNFAVKMATFHTPWSPGPLKGQNFANFWT